MPATPESRARTRSFARVIGPFAMIVPGAVAIRAATGTLGEFSGFFDSPLAVWGAAALLLFAGLLILANHQYWSSPAAIIISLFGWFLFLRGLVLIAAPQVMQSGVDVAMSAGIMPVVIAGFSLLALLGAYLSFVGYLAKPPA